MSHRSTARHVPERFLRQLWRRQHFILKNLKTTDGKTLEVFSPGKYNPDGGPDFRDATVRIQGIIYHGDVEMHRHAGEWLIHAHHHDPKYNSVILHVVLTSDTTIPQQTESARSLPVLALDPYLNSSYHSLWETMIMSERTERLDTIKCYHHNEDVEPAVIKQWLTKLAVERMELKVRRFEERLKELIDEHHPVVKDPPTRYGEIPFGLNPEDLPAPTSTVTQHELARHEFWDQLLYEGVMEALGYAKNQLPFTSLARNLTLDQIQRLLDHTPDETNVPLRIESLLLNIAGLIPPIKDIRDHEGKLRVRKLRELWKRCRKHYHREMLHAAQWQFFRLRPENFPTVRIAGAAHLIVRFLGEDILKSIIQVCKSGSHETGRRVQLLESMFIVASDDFWSSHYQLKERAKVRLNTLVGTQRAHDIILNVVIPICLLYARLFKDRQVRQGTLEIFELARSTSDTVITRTLQEQLLREKLTLDSAMLQQGAVQLYKHYCIEERCSECLIGKTVFTR